MREDAPGRRPQQIAKIPCVLSAEVKDAALAELDKDVLAASTHRTYVSRLKTIGKMLALWGFDPMAAYADDVEGIGFNVEALRVLV